MQTICFLKGCRILTKKGALKRPFYDIYHKMKLLSIQNNLPVCNCFFSDNEQ